MTTAQQNLPLVFGKVLGYAPGNVPSYSSDYDTVDNEEIPDRHAFRSYLNGVYTGYKWQCVEFARRWLLINKGYVFDDISMAYDIFRLNTVKHIEQNINLPLYSFHNGSSRPPEVGCMLIWSEGGEFDTTGHVAIVTEVFDDKVRIAEQNLDHKHWPEGCNYSRELPAQVSDDGGYWIQCSFDDASILGWVIQTDDATFSAQFEEKDPALFNLQLRKMETMPSNKKVWLNVANPDEAAYVKTMNGSKLSSNDEEQDLYFCVSKTAQLELKRATNELHRIFLHATDYVLRNDHLLERFNIPKILWPRIHQSWNNRRNQMITGRFDFAMTKQGLKVYEYNADSASCHMECGKVQGRWAAYANCNDGDDPGSRLLHELMDAWKESDVDGLVHILLDHDDEELYHALFMQQAMTKAGIKSKLIRGLGCLSFNEQGEVIDDENNIIRWVWKTWAWETALDQLREELDEEAQHAALNSTTKSKPRLMDVLFQPDTMVFEPLWTLIPSNKAILPILWEMFPEYPYLLNSQYEVTPELAKNGYVSKPIAGRCGFNISIVDPNNNVLSETVGQFDNQNQIYQELFKLPNIEGFNAQLCTFTAAGTYAGLCVRTDPSLIITTQSDLLPLRVVADKLFN